MGAVFYSVPFPVTLRWKVALSFSTRTMGSLSSGKLLPFEIIVETFSSTASTMLNRYLNSANDGTLSAFGFSQFNQTAEIYTVFILGACVASYAHHTADVQVYMCMFACMFTMFACRRRH